MTWFQSDVSALKMSGSGDMKSSGDMTKASSVGFNQVEIASVGNKSQEMETEIEKKVTSHFCCHG